MAHPDLARPTARELLAQQDRVLSRRQALAGGMSPAAWRWGLESGRWQLLLPGVVVAHTGEVTDLQRWWGAVLYAGDHAALTGDTALLLSGMKLDSPETVHVVVPPARQLRRQVFRDGAARDQGGRASGTGGRSVTIQRSQRVGDWRHPVSLPPRLRVAPSLLHAFASAGSDRQAEWRVAAAVQQRLVRVSDVRRHLALLPNLRRHALLQAVLDDVEFGAHAASELEFLRFLRRHRLPRPDRLQHAVRAGGMRYLDGHYDRQRVGIEIDGAHHRSVLVWNSDVLRTNDLMVSNTHDRLLLLRYTTANLRHDEPRVADQLRAVLL